MSTAKSTPTSTASATALPVAAPLPAVRRAGGRLLALLGALVALLLLGALAFAAMVVLHLYQAEPLVDSSPQVPAAQQQVGGTPAERGAYLARVGNCMQCHTATGGTPYAGGRGIETPFGVVYSTNLTADADTGMGRWTQAEFWRALHHGRSRDGRLLYPAFPYTSYTQVTRADADALFAFLQGVPAAVRPNRPHALRFPYDTQLALAAWRTLFFQPGADAPVPPVPPAALGAQAPAWQRGAYLVGGLGHCAACHTPRNALGASLEARALGGGLIPVQNWYAPALDKATEAGVAHWPLQEVVDLLKIGVAPQGSVIGPMAEVVFNSTQYLSDADAAAMALYLQSLPPRQSAAAEQEAQAAPAAGAVPDARGAKVYEQQCAQCHGEQGEGKAGAFPALAGNRALVMDDPTNVLRVLLQGGYLPATAGNPRPHGMPPFLQTLEDEDLAAVATFVRGAWGNRAGRVDTIDAHRARERRAP